MPNLLTNILFFKLLSLHVHPLREYLFKDQFVANPPFFLGKIYDICLPDISAKQNEF